MKRKIIAIACTVILNFSAAHSANIDAVGNYSNPPMMAFLISGGADVDPSFDPNQMGAYCMTFGMMLNQEWPGKLPDKISEFAPEYIKMMMLTGVNVNEAAIDGANDAKLFASGNWPESDAALNAIKVLKTLVTQ